ncbi:MAG: VanW family protein [Candidatus Andersenbacteria bacterium]|nr:VanW family protein [Candidatus Andersenbacteria bacterium]
MPVAKLSLTICAGLLVALPARADSILTKEVAVNSDALARAAARPFTLTAGQKKWTVPVSAVKTWYKTRGSTDMRLQLRPSAIYDYLNVHVSPQVNQLGAGSRFKSIDGNLHLLAGGTKGKIVDGVKTSLAIRSALLAGQSSAAVSMKDYRPAVFTAADFKKLTFPDRLGRGESSFAGSPKNRIHNITVATARYDGLVLMPGEQFSFNAHLGAVDNSNGYLPELVIKENVTTPEYGGGICQVSTTAFRAALQSGLKINARRHHSYPVAYYGAPGYDATVYPPNPDLTFTNDTGQPVYIETKIIGRRLIFDVWGKNDGRQVTVNGPFTTARRPDGSLTAAVAQIVKQNGKTLREENFVSNYQSPDKFPTIRKANGG